MSLGNTELSGVVLNNVASSGSLYISWGVLRNSTLLISSSSFNGYLQQSGTLIENTNVTVTGTVLTDGWYFQSAATNSNIQFLSGKGLCLNIGAYAFARSSLLINGSTFVRSDGDNVAFIDATFTASLLHVDRCTLTGNGPHVIVLGASVPSGGVHRLTNNVITNTITTTASGNVPTQGGIAYSNGVSLLLGSQLHISNNKISISYSLTYAEYVVSSGGQIVHDELNQCTYGKVYFETKANAPAHTIHINRFNGLTSLSINGSSYILANSTIGTCDVNVRPSACVTMLLAFLTCSSYLTVGLGPGSIEPSVTVRALTTPTQASSLGTVSRSVVDIATSSMGTLTISGSISTGSKFSIAGCTTTVVATLSTWRMYSNKYIGGPPTTSASVATIVVLCAGCKLLAVGSAIQIEGNTLISFSTASNAVSLVDLQCTLTLEGESKLSIRDNEYFMVSSSGAKPALLLGNLSLSGTAAVDMSHNAFTATATGPCPPPMARIEGISSSMPQQSSVTVSTNALSINTSVPSSLACPCLSIGTLASGLTVHSNTVSSNASNTTLVAVGAMSVPSPGIMKIAENSLRLDAPGGSLLAVSGYLTLEGRSGISVVDNRVTRLSSFAITAPLYYLVTVNALNMSASQTALTVCGNTVYGDGSSSFKPDRFLMPPSMVNIAKRCSITSSGSHSPSASEPPSITVSITSSGSHLPPASESPSISSQLAVTDTASSVASHSLSGLVSSSESMTNTLPITGSRTPPLTDSDSLEKPPTSSISLTANVTLSEVLRNTATLTLSHSCQNLTDVNVDDTCEVLRLAEWLPPAGSESPVAASLVFGAGDCTSLKIPYSAWTGRRGSSHHLRIIATDPRVPIYEGTELPNSVPDSGLFASVASETTEDLTLTFTSESDVAAARRRGLIPPSVGGNLTIRFQVGLATVTYLGSSTLNQLKYRLDCGSWPRCPIPMPSAFEVTLLASDKIFPVALSETVAVGSVIASIGGGVTVSPSVAAQLGVLRQMSRCDRPDPDDEEASDYDQYAKGSTLNPFGISIGEGGGARRYVRGSEVMSVVYALCLSALMFAFTTASSRISHRFHAKAGAPPSLLVGYPSALVAVGSFVMDGAASAGIVLGVQGATASDWVVGWLFVLLCLVFVGQMILATVRWLPPSLVAEPHLPEATLRVRSMRKWLGSATHKWAGTDSDEAAAQWMCRYGGVGYRRR